MRKIVSKRYAYMKAYRDQHPEYVAKNRVFLFQFKKQNPWYGSWATAKSRCMNPNVACYYRYGGRGIKFLLTQEEVKQLWKRDKAYHLKQPCIDRLNNDGDYEYANCRFIERSINSTKGNYETRWR